LNLFHPATGEVRARGVTSSANVVLHPWLQAELSSILASLPPAPALPAADLPAVRRWETWLGRPPSAPLPPIRLILIWDNLAGHKTPTLVHWLLHQGIVPLYTPLSGSWLNMAESVQHILGERALAGTHPQSAAEIIAWLEATVAGWNRAPTPFIWGGKRLERRERARARRRARRLRGSGATISYSMPIAA
jgi:DDE superfamily endonuclease